MVPDTFSLLRQDGAYFSIYDGIGSTLALINQSGTSAVQYSYEPFGKTQSSTPSFGNSFQFTGRENDSSDLYYYRTRYYSSLFNRFVSEDTIGFLGGDNFYRYVENNPVNRIDPLGLTPCCPSGRTKTMSSCVEACVTSPVPHWSFNTWWPQWPAWYPRLYWAYKNDNRRSTRCQSRLPSRGRTWCWKVCNRNASQSGLYHWEECNNCCCHSWCRCFGICNRDGRLLCLSVLRRSML